MRTHGYQAEEEVYLQVIEGGLGMMKKWKLKLRNRPGELDVFQP
jgi:hypothetical protein